MLFYNEVSSLGVTRIKENIPPCYVSTNSLGLIFFNLFVPLLVVKSLFILKDI